MKKWLWITFKNFKQYTLIMRIGLPFDFIQVTGALVPGDGFGCQGRIVVEGCIFAVLPIFDLVQFYLLARRQDDQLIAADIAQELVGADESPFVARCYLVNIAAYEI